MQRVVIMFPGALGDAILALPTWRLLRQRHLRAHLTVVVNGSLIELVRSAGVADSVERLDGPDVAGFFGGGRLPPWMIDQPVVYSWFGATDADARARLTAAAATLVLARVERGAPGPHAAVVYARHVGEEPGLEALAALTRLSAVVRLPDPSPLLVVQAGAGAAAKRWRLDQVAAVVKWWRARGGETIELRGPAEVDATPIGADRVCDGHSLVQVAMLLRGALAYLGNDSGISHLAGAVGCRGVVVFGPTRAPRWRPLGGCLTALAPPRPQDFPAAMVETDQVVAVLEGLRNLDKPPIGI